MNPKIDRMLGLTAEIAEELLIVKDTDSDHLSDDLKLKIISLAELAATVESPDDTDQATDQATQPEPEQAAESDTIDTVAPEEIEEMESEAIAESVTDDNTPDVTIATPSDTPVTTDQPASLDQLVSLDQSDPSPQSDPSSQSADDIAAEAVAAEFEEQADADETTAPTISGETIYRSFTINDAFLYRREIFNGSKPLMMEVLDYIGSLPDMAAVQNYLTTDLGLSLDQSPGKEFSQALSVFFG